MLIFALSVLLGCFALVVAQRARAQAAAPIRCDIRVQGHPDTSGTCGVGNDPATPGGRGYRNC